MNPETKIENDACKKILDELGVASLKLNVKGNNGYPDRLFWIPGGRPLLIEFKVPGEEPRPQQAHIHGILRTLGYEVQVHDDPIRALEAVRKKLDALAVPRKRR